jgi:hypothetical protein
MSAMRRPVLSARSRRLLFAYQDHLCGHRGAHVTLRAMASLGDFVRWAGEADLARVRPRALAVYRRRVGGHSRRFGVVRDLYRFLYCRGYLAWDPVACLGCPRAGRGAL